MSAEKFSDLKSETTLIGENKIQSSMKNFFSYKIYTQPFDPELLSGLMWEFEITGLLENDDHITVFTSDNSSTNEEQFNLRFNEIKK